MQVGSKALRASGMLWANSVMDIVRCLPGNSAQGYSLNVTECQILFSIGDPMKSDCR
jgi:hypothetical protein